MNTNEMIVIAEELKKKISTTKPVLEWSMTPRVWFAGEKVRVYVNNRKNKTAAMFEITGTGDVTPTWFPGESMTRNELKKSLGLK